MLLDDKMQYVDLVVALALLQFVFFTLLTGRARDVSGLKAPAVTGNEDFERMYRVQMNTLELLIAFVPAMFLAAKYWLPALVAGLGAVFLIGRFVYWRAYISDPAKRAAGFALSLFPTAILVAMALVGIVLSLIGVKG
jgi:glutathione S-transferase